MSTPSAQPAGGSTRRVLLAIGVLVIIVAVVVAFLLGRGSSKTATKPPASTTTGTTQPTTVTSTQAPLNVNGCLGGPDPTLAIGSVFTAPLTPAGAVEFTATVSRWLVDSTKTSAQYTQIAPKLMSPDLVTRYTTVAPAGQTTSLSTEGSVYKVSGFTPQKVTVTMSSVVTITDNSGLQRTQDGVGDFTLTAKDGHWTFSDVPPPGQEGSAGSQQTIDEMEKGSTPLPGGCG